MNQGVTTDVFFELREVVCAWQLAINQKVGVLEKALLAGKFFDRITAVAKNSLVAVDVGNRRASGRGVYEARVKGV